MPGIRTLTPAIPPTIIINGNMIHLIRVPDKLYWPSRLAIRLDTSSSLSSILTKRSSVNYVSSPFR
jgi:hypothetical protein